MIFYANELASKTRLLFKDVYCYYMTLLSLADVFKLNLLGTFGKLYKQRFALHLVYCKAEAVTVSIQGLF